MRAIGKSGGADGLPCPWMEHWLEALGKIRLNVVPDGRNVFLGEQKLGGVHRKPPKARLTPDFL
jgi:hypothetical protein